MSARLGRSALALALLALAPRADAQEMYCYEVTPWIPFFYAEGRDAKALGGIAYLLGDAPSTSDDDDIPPVLFDPPDDVKPPPKPTTGSAPGDHEVVFDPDGDLKPLPAPASAPNDGWIEVESVAMPIHTTSTSVWAPEIYALAAHVSGDAVRPLTVTYWGAVSFENDPKTGVPVIEVAGQLIGFDDDVFASLGLEDAVKELR